MYKNLIWLLIWLLFLCSSRILKAQDEKIELELKQHRSIKICGEEKDRKFQISVSVGEIKNEDEYYAVELFLTYNPEKIKFVSFLKINTLAEFFEFTDVHPWEPGFVTVSASAKGMVNAYGNKPLLALEVEYIGECDDTTMIYLENLDIDISQNFKNRLNYKGKSLLLDADVMAYPSSFVEARFLTDTISEYNSDSAAGVTVNVNTNGLQKTDSLDFLFKYEKGDNFKIENIVLMNEKIIRDSVLEYEEGDTSYYLLKTHLTGDLPDESAFEVRFKRNKKIDDTVKIMMGIANINDCTCATNLRGDKMSLISKKDTTTAIANEFENNENEIDAFYDFMNNEFVIKTDESTIEMVKMYNINGGLIFKNDLGWKNEYRVTADGFYDGIYFSRIKLINGFEKNIVLIKN